MPSCGSSCSRKTLRIVLVLTRFPLASNENSNDADERAALVPNLLSRNEPNIAPIFGPKGTNRIFPNLAARTVRTLRLRSKSPSVIVDQT